MRLNFAVIFLYVIINSAISQVAQISNVTPRSDDSGKIVDAHDGRVIKFGEKFYWYGTQYSNTNGFTIANKYVAYSSTDMMNWKLEGDLLKDAPEGIHYRPHVIYNKQTKQYVLWYNWYPKLWDGQFGVAVSKTPEGPFKIVNPDTKVSKSEIGVGDLGLFVDEDNIAYISYNSIQNHQLVVERLNSSYTKSTMETSNIIAEHVEAGSMFKREGLYYLLTDYTCCFCNYGSGARVYTAKDPLGPYKFSSNINRFPGKYAPELTDGMKNINLTYRLKKENGLIIENISNAPISTVQIQVFTGNRNGLCGAVDSAWVHPPITIPEFSFSANGIEVNPTNRVIKKIGLRNILTFEFDSFNALNLELKVSSYSYDQLSLLEVEINKGQSKIMVFESGEGIGKQPIIPAQQSYVMELPTKNGIQYIWMGDLWGSANDNIKGHDFQYWSAPLQFNEDGSIQRMQWVDEWEVELK
ncbi:family 43 glycosylhydrolase [Ekhidna sp.]